MERDMNDKNTIQDVLKMVEQQLSEMPDFSQMQLHIKKHTGSFGHADVMKQTSRRYSDDEPNVSCTSDVLTLIKQIADAKLTGSLSFNITFKRGRADFLAVQDFKKL